MSNIIERKKDMLSTKTQKKRCPECQQFFFGGRIDKIYCSKKCYFKKWAREHPRTKINIIVVLIAYFALFFIPSCQPQPAYSEDIDFDRLTQTIIQCESSNRPFAVSKKGAIGLMGILPQGALAEWNMKCEPDYNIGDLYNPSINVRIGRFYISELYHYYKCDTIEKLAYAYNAGPTRARKNNFDAQKAPKETQLYIKKISRVYDSKRP